MSLANQPKTPTKVIKRFKFLTKNEREQHCFICGLNFHIAGEINYRTVKKYKHVFRKVIDNFDEIPHAQDSCNLKVCRKCTSKAENVLKLKEKMTNIQNELVENYNQTNRNFFATTESVKRLKNPTADTPPKQLRKKRLMYDESVATRENVSQEEAQQKENKDTGKRIGFKQVKVTVETIESGTRKSHIISGDVAIVIKHLSMQNVTGAVNVLMSTRNTKQQIVSAVINCCKEELKNISKKSSSSILSVTDANSIKNLSIDSVCDEFEEKIPTIKHIIEGVCRKDEKFCVTQICNTIVSLYNQKMSALRYMNGLFLRYCGLNQMGLTMLCKMRIVIHPNQIVKKMYELGDNHKEVLLNWKHKIEAEPDLSLAQGYQIIGDNLDMNINTRHQTVSNDNSSYHWFNMYAVKDKVTGNQLSNKHQRRLKDVPLENFLPTLADLKKLESNFINLVSRILVKHIPNMETLKNSQTHHINHQYSEKMETPSEQVPLGVYALNENNQDQMLEILERVQESFGIKDGEGGFVDAILFGGDQLTEERSRCMQFAKSNGRSAEERLDGLIPKFEDWHAIRIAYQAAINIFSSPSAVRDSGTYFSNAIKSVNRNALKDPIDNYQKVKEFFEMETRALMVSAFLRSEGFDKAEDFTFPSNIDKEDNAKLHRWLNGRIHLFLKSKVLPILEDLVKLGEDKKMKCRASNCHKEFYFMPAKNLHEEIDHGLPPVEKPENSDVAEGDDDDLYKYSCCRLCIGLLLANADDAVKEADGDRLVRVWNFLTFFFKLTKHHKYAYLGLKLKASELALLCPRKWHQLKWNRFVNVKGGKAKNISLDLRLEHINKITKEIIKTQGAQNISNESVERISKSVGAIEDLAITFKVNADVAERSGAHCNPHKYEIFRRVFDEVHNHAKNFSIEPGRKLNHFTDFESKIFSRQDRVDLFKWIKRCVKRWDVQNVQFYKF